MSPWLASVPPRDSFGLLGAWSETVNHGGTALAAYRGATEDLETHADVSGLGPHLSNRERRRYAAVEQADGIEVHALETIGLLRGNAAVTEQAILGLETDILTDDPDFNTEVALLNKLTAAQVVALRAQQDTNKLLVALLEQQMAATKAWREHAAISINNDIGFRARVSAVHETQTRGISRALDSYRMP